VSRATIVAMAMLVILATGAAPAAHAQSPTRYAFFFNLGAGGLSGDFADIMHTPQTGEFGILMDKEKWRYGLGVSFGSFAFSHPYEQEAEWGFQRIFVSGTRMFNLDRRLHPYIQGRFGIVRLHPRSDLYDKNPLPPDYQVGDSPTPAANGFQIAAVPGVEWKFLPGVALDVSVMFDYFKVSQLTLAPVGQTGKSGDSGFDWQIRAGLTWWTDNGPDGEPAPQDAWGVTRSYGWAIGEALSINFGASAFNEYVRNANFNQISPRSWWSNWKEGFTYDDNKFKTNQYIHPFNGSQYYNASRSNGLGFWPSYAIGLMGAYQWELAGETHPMSFNDIISTGIGGAAMGETMYRFSSLILDNTSTGKGRFFREAGAFLVDPIRGFNRIVSKRAWKVDANPSDPIDHNPPNSLNDLNAGWRRIGDTPSLERNYHDYFFVRYAHEHGNVFKNSRSKPWDFFTADARWNFGDKTRLGALIIQGNWFSAPIGSGPSPKHAGALVQYFDYVNNNAYEYGGQAIGGAVFSNWGSAGPFAMGTRFDVMGTILGAVNSNYSVFAEVANQERIREYDYGPGLGGKAAIAFSLRGQRFLTASYRFNFLSVTNGSVYNKDGAAGLDASHWLHAVEARLDTPTHNHVGLGASYSSFTRESHYRVHPAGVDPALSVLQKITQTNPEVRVYVRYTPWQPGSL